MTDTPLPVKQTLFFLHIPKCAGMSLTDTLLSVLPPQEVYQSTSMIKNFWEQRPEFVEIPQKKRLRAVVGHWVHEEMLPMLNKPIYCATSLRDPVSRIKSQYKFDIGLRGGNWEVPDTGTFLGQNKNVICEFLTRAFPTISREYDSTLEAAKAVLSSFDCVFDVSEADQEISNLVSLVTDLDTDVKRSNESKSVSAKLDASDEEIGKYCEIDQELYDWFKSKKADGASSKNPVFSRENRKIIAKIAHREPSFDALKQYMIPRYASELFYGADPVHVEARFNQKIDFLEETLQAMRALHSNS